MDSAMMDMAGATCIPATRLFGRSPAGMNSTGESDEKMYRQTLEHERAIHITPALERLIPIVCHSAIGRFPKGARFKYPSLLEMMESDKMQIVDQQYNTLERMFQANLIPADAVLEAIRDTQNSLDLTSPIKDEHIEHVRGKYMNDLQQQADPYGGAMQTANEAGMESGAEQVDENGNPIEQPQVDENGNPIEQPVDENGNPIEQEPSQDDIDAAKAEYEGIVKSVPSNISQDIVSQVAMQEKITPEQLKEKMQQAKEQLIKRKKLLKKYERIIKSMPGEVSQDLVSELAALNQTSPEELQQQMEAEYQAKYGVEEQQQAQPQEVQEQQEKQPQAQPQRDSYYPMHNRIKHVRSRDDEDFRFEKFTKRPKRRGFDY
jgi:hypothetical protein